MKTFIFVILVISIYYISTINTYQLKEDNNNENNVIASSNKTLLPYRDHYGMIRVQLDCEHIAMEDCLLTNGCVPFRYRTCCGRTGVYCAAYEEYKCREALYCMIKTDTGEICEMQNECIPTTGFEYYLVRNFSCEDLDCESKGEKCAYVQNSCESTTCCLFPTATCFPKSPPSSTPPPYPSLLHPSTPSPPPLIEKQQQQQQQQQSTNNNNNNNNQNNNNYLSNLFKIIRHNIGLLQSKDNNNNINQKEDNQYNNQNNNQNNNNNNIDQLDSYILNEDENIYEINNHFFNLNDESNYDQFINQNNNQNNNNNQINNNNNNNNNIINPSIDDHLGNQQQQQQVEQTKIIQTSGCGTTVCPPSFTECIEIEGIPVCYSLSERPDETTPNQFLSDHGFLEKKYQQIEQQHQQQQLRYKCSDDVCSEGYGCREYENKFVCLSFDYIESIKESI
ncbi:hypothetical protein DFA_11092 [Cavenderia fasciculata]|uniref:DSCP-N domain-containing protein n=1 Tax=Cavenderia fasciculata TaxID=261658 RepID=F4QES0_CACFS|nr:uncharacterized protein DFA_11092 [Cavenderia fasciculata]EGG13331.1 hypothetical protein DFA_11092 [Cavenderia fasciculata]|eukprot:XP_004350035.1 hypothetical protein DFA_11092 [Cavenderia fasciculata]